MALWMTATALLECFMAINSEGSLLLFSLLSLILSFLPLLKFSAPPFSLSFLFHFFSILFSHVLHYFTPISRPPFLIHYLPSLFFPLSIRQSVFLSSFSSFSVYLSLRSLFLLFPNLFPSKTRWWSLQNPIYFHNPNCTPWHQPYIPNKCTICPTNSKSHFGYSWEQRLRNRHGGRKCNKQKKGK